MSRTSQIEAIRVMVNDWLQHRFEWDGTPIGDLVAHVQVEFDGEVVDVWGTDPGFVPAAAPSNGDQVNWDALSAAFHNEDGTSRFDGLLIHPHTKFSADALETLAWVVIGCLERNDPTGPYHLDPKTVELPDTRVIMTPHPVTTNARRLLNVHGWDYPKIAAGTTAYLVAKLAAHEALELHQSTPGVPEVDPHKHQIPCSVTFHDGVSVSGNI